jgi:hypothetical protein
MFHTLLANKVAGTIGFVTVVQIYFMTLGSGSRAFRYLPKDRCAMGQWVERQPAPPNICGYSQIAYNEINPPMLDPIKKVNSRSGRVR